MMLALAVPTFALLAVLFAKTRSWGLLLLLLGGAANIAEGAVFGRIHDIFTLGSLEYNPADVVIFAGAGVTLLTCLPWRKTT